MPIENPENDRRTNAYKRAAAERGDLFLEPDVEAFASFIYDAGYRGTPDKSYWVPTEDIEGVVRAEFPKSPYLTNRQLGQAIRAAEPDSIRVRRRPKTGADPVYGWAGIRGPSDVRTK